MSTFYSFFDSFRGPRACLVCLLAKVAQIGHQRCMWCQPILRAPTFAWHAPRVGPVRTKPAPGSGPTFHPESRGGHKKKIGKALFSRAPPLPTFFARLDPRRRRRNFFGTQSRLAKMSHSMAWVWGGMSPCVLLASYLRVGAWAPWEAPCTLPWPFQAMGPSEPPKMASGLQNG